MPDLVIAKHQQPVVNHVHLRSVISPCRRNHFGFFIAKPCSHSSKCSTGFAGTVSASCNAGSWTIVGSCATTTCATLPPIPNTDAGDCAPTTPTGTSCVPVCSTGYNGTVSAKCENRVWQTEGLCEEAPCTSPPTIDNANSGNCATSASGSSCIPQVCCILFYSHSVV